MMDEQTFLELPEEFTGMLLDFCVTSGPSPAFIAGLEERLLVRQAELAASKLPGSLFRRLRRPINSLTIHRKWQYALVVILLAVAGAVLAIGPQRVLAQVQLWLGYLPGIGFVNPGQTRALAAPVQARQGDTLLEVQQVIAGPEKTMVIALLSGSPQEITLDTEWVSQVTLILPDGQRLARQQASQDNQAGQLRAEIEYPPLPEGIEQVTLEMPTLPMSTGGSQEYWSVILPLQEVALALTQANPSWPQTPSTGGNLVVSPYTPANTQSSNQGVTVRVLQIAQSSEETGVLVQIEWEDPAWVFMGVSGELQDDQGRIYAQLEPLPGSNNSPVAATPGAMAQQTLRFAPIDPTVRKITLVVDSISFEVHSQAQFRFDPGNQPTLGQTWSYNGDTDKRVQIAGFDIQVLTARLTSATDSIQPRVQNPPGVTGPPPPTPLPEPAYRLEFTLQVFSQPGASLVLGSPSLDGEKWGPSGANSTGDSGKTTIYLDLPEIPTTPLTVQLNDAFLLLEGGWQMEWEIP